MTFVVTEACIRCKYTDCVDVCPVDAFREGPNFLVIDPDECIDCAVCVPECVTAIISLGLLVLAVNLALFPNLTSFELANRDSLRVVLGLALLAATLGFVPFNFNPASIFMGDAGSLFLGFMCALLIILMGEVEARWLLAAMVMFALPVLDTALAFARRKLAGRAALLSPDKQHLHHQLVARGLSVKQAVLTAYALAIFFVICGIAIVYIRTRYAVGFYLVLFGSIIVAAYKMGMIHERIAKAPRPRWAARDSRRVPKRSSRRRRSPRPIERVVVLCSPANRAC